MNIQNQKSNITFRSLLAALSLLFIFSPIFSLAGTGSNSSTQNGTASIFCYTFTTNIGMGSSGAEVSALQALLQEEFPNEPVNQTGVFDESTAAVVSQFQEKYASDILTPNGLYAGTGYVGASTRMELNALYGCPAPTSNTGGPGTLAFYQGPSPITSATCGTAITTQVSGYASSQIWLTQQKLSPQTGSSWVTSYDGPYTVPNTYTFVCNQDEGTYSNTAYTLVNGQKGSVIGSTVVFFVNPASTVTTSPTTKFALNNLVQVSGISSAEGSLNIRSGPSITSTLLGSEPDGATGTVVGGPSPVDSYGYTWWQINWGNVTAWAVQDYLSPVTNITAPTSVATPTTITTRTTPTTSNTTGASPVTPTTSSTASRPAPNVSTPTPVTGPSNATYTFSGSSGTLVAGKDTWLYTLSGGNPGDVLSVYAYKNNALIGNIVECTIPTTLTGLGYASTCSSISVPVGTNDIGAWSEGIYINGIQKANVSFNVVAAGTTPTTSTTSVTPTNTTTSSAMYTFYPNGGTLVAGTGSWTFMLSRANPGDTLTVNAYKNGVLAGNNLSICTVPANNGNSPIQASGCSASATAQAGDIGNWTENVYIDGVYKGNISFSVVASATSVNTVPAIQSTPSFSFSGNGQNLVAGQSSWTYTLLGAKSGDTLYADTSVNNGTPTNYTICTVATGATSCSASATPGTNDIGSWFATMYDNTTKLGTVAANVVAPGGTSSTPPPTPSVSCSLSLTETNIKVGDNVSWTVSSSPAGYSAYWYITKNGATDVSNSLAGTTNFTQSYTYGAGDVGSYTLQAVIEDSSGNTLCTTSQIDATVSAQTSMSSGSLGQGLANVLSGFKTIFGF